MKRGDEVAVRALAGSPYLTTIARVVLAQGDYVLVYRETAKAGERFAVAHASQCVPA